MIQIGNTVKWSSQSAGYIKPKQGEVVAVVPANELAPVEVQGLRLRNPGGARDHESYVVRVGRKLYWPRVSHLKRAG